MIDNQEKELFNILSNLVTEVRGIKTDVQDIKETQSEHTRILNEHSQTLNEHSRILNEHSQTLNEHSRILNEHSQTLNEHSRILNEHSQTLNEHSRILNEHSQTLNLLVSKVDTIAGTVITNDKRLTAVEKDVDDLRSEVH
jgi:methyl-accepting chemotaxis protein